MIAKDENIILFPKLRKKLEEESLKDLKEKKYEQALTKLNKLLDYHINDHEIVFGKLICLMELGWYEEAISLCEELINDRTENHYHYVHVYLTILFQTNQYHLLIEHIEKELRDENLPRNVKEQFKQLYELSKQMNDDIIKKEANEYYIELTEAIKDSDHIRQWQLLENLRKMKTKPKYEIILYLENDQIHPVIKTVIFKWLQDHKISDKVKVCKFGVCKKLKPMDIPPIRAHSITKQVLLSINDVEQENPSLYIMLEQLLYRYLYVRYPFMPESLEIEVVSLALRQIGLQYLHMPNQLNASKETIDRVQEIQTCEQFYLSIIEE